MKLALISFLLSAPLGFSSFALANGHTNPRPQHAARPIVQTDWTIKMLFEVESKTSISNAAQTGNEIAQMQASLEARKTISDIIGPVMNSLSDPTHQDAESLGQMILRASTQLTAAAKQLQLNNPNLTTTMNYVIFPVDHSKPLKDSGDALTEDKSNFETQLFANMHLLQESGFGTLNDGRAPVYILGATVSMKLTPESGEAHLQIVAALNPQEIPGDTPISIPGANDQEQTVMLLDITQTLQVPLPNIDITFGKLGLLQHESWKYRFGISGNESICSRAQSTPKLWQKQGIWIPLPVYGVTIDLNKEQIVDADVRLGLMGCWNISYVQNQFLTQANQKLLDAKNLITSLLGQSPDEFAATIAREREAAGIKVNSDGD